MSFVYDIRNLKNCSDFKSKREEFFKLLRLQARLNRNYEQAAIAREQMEELGITPVPQSRRSMEDEAKDLILQQQLAMKNLQSIMADDQARAVINKMAEDQVYMLNSEFGRLRPYLEGRTNITAEFFNKVFDHYKAWLASTGGTGVPIPLRESTIEKMPGDLKDEWMNFSRQDVDPMTGKTPDLDELIRRTADALNRTEEDVKMEVDDEVKMEEEQAQPSTPAPSAPMGGAKRKGISKSSLLMKKPRLEERQGVKRQLEDMFEQEAGPDQKKPRKKGPKKFLVPTEEPMDEEEDIYAPAIIQGLRKRRMAQQEGFLPEKKPKLETESAEMRGLKRKNEMAVEVEAEKIARLGGLTLDEAKSLAREEILARQEAYVPPSRQYIRPPTPPRKRKVETMPSAPAKKTKKSGLAQAKEEARMAIEQRAEARASELGQGLFMSPQRPTSDYGAAHSVFSTFDRGGGLVRQRNGKILGKVGRGIEENAYGRYRQIGRYILHMPSLRKSYINIKYPSKIIVPSIPQKYVSHAFVDMVMKLLDEGVLDKTLFNALSEEEQNYFRMVANKCEFESLVGMNIASNLSAKEKEENERFEMLRGTIVAGNNSPEVLNEMKMYILKFINEKRMPKQQGHDLLYEIACLT